MGKRAAVCHVLCGLLFTTLAWAAGGSGTVGDPYVIADIAELQAIQQDLAAHYVLGGDIDATETASWNGGTGFTPIGSNPDPFTGVLDGRGHVVSHLYINRLDQSLVGLFGVAQTAAIRNLGINEAEVHGNLATGILLGRATRETLVSSSWATGILTLKPGSADAKSGGLVGAVGSGSRVDQCFSNVEVFASSRRQVGGLVGYLRGVETTWPTATISNSYAAGTVHGNGSKQGNLLGDADGSRVDRCYSSGLGKALVGFNYRSPTITDSYWDSDRGAPTSPYGGVGRTTVAMMRQATFVGWDFENIWGIDEEESYPFLRFERSFEMTGFDVVSLNLAFRQAAEDSLGFSAFFTLDDLSDGIEPALEPIRVRVGSFSETLPAGALTCRGSGVCIYRSEGAGVVLLAIRENDDGGTEHGQYFAWMAARSVDLSGTTVPLEVALEIGNDEGRATARPGGVLRIPARAESSRR